MSDESVADLYSNTLIKLNLEVALNIESELVQFEWVIKSVILPLPVQNLS